MQEFQTIFQDSSLIDIKRCLSCGSVFVTENECESCGKQFHQKLVGTPLGDKSFYFLKKTHENSLPQISKIFPFIDNDNSLYLKKYRRKLKKRFEVLLGFLTSKLSEDDDNRRKVFFVELKDIMEEMINSGVEYNWVVKQIKQVEDEDLLKSLFFWVQSIDHQRKKFSIMDFLINFRLFGALRIGVLFMFVSGTIIVSSIALSFFRLNY